MALYTKFPFKTLRADGSVAVWIETTELDSLFDLAWVKAHIDEIEWAAVRTVMAACPEDLEHIA